MPEPADYTPLTAEELEQQVLTEPAFESLKVDLLPDDLPPPRELLAAALAESGVAAPPAEAWEVDPVHESLPDSYFLVPPEAAEVAVEDAWSLTYALQRQGGVVDAEPLFDTVLDVADQPSQEGADDEDDGDGDVEAMFAAAAAGDGDCAPVPVDESDHDWSPKLVNAPAAWAIEPPAGGARRGRGIRIGHPDSGFVTHRELFDADEEGQSRVLAHLGHDFVDDDPDPQGPDGSHGLGTASVAMSFDAARPDENFVHGVAPEAEIVPFRVAKRWWLTPVLVFGGMRRLAKSIYRAVDAPASCHVISISLGFLRNKAVRQAVDHAFENDVIVVAAAGNGVRFVVWPARYPEVIAVAGCTAGRRKWKGSSRGKSVDVTAPARRVWRAQPQPANAVEQGDGTSFATPTTAGLAALWLAFWNRDALLARYAGEFKLTTVFRRVLRDSCDPPPPNANGEFGAGIVNACRLLRTPLPTVEELRASDAHVVEAMAMGAAAPVAGGGLDAVAEALDRTTAEVRAPLAAMTSVEPARLPQELHGVGDELAFHILTNPELRSRMVAPDDDEIGAAGAASAEAMRAAIDVSRMSPRLRTRLNL
ncbi:MAG TPA: S8/S53 family peptidase [Thermoanaerobaculia bacterium]|nr:S8/S53 family peptidase [Thermoanaerobaculia bacterium]